MSSHKEKGREGRVKSYLLQQPRQEMIVSRTNGSGDKWSDSQYILKVEVVVFLGVLANTFVKKGCQR